MSSPARERALLLLFLATAAFGAEPLNAVEATIPEMQTAPQAKRTTSRELVTQYRLRIATYAARLNTVIAASLPW